MSLLKGFIHAHMKLQYKAIEVQPKTKRGKKEFLTEYLQYDYYSGREGPSLKIGSVCFCFVFCVLCGGFFLSILHFGR